MRKNIIVLFMFLMVSISYLSGCEQTGSNNNQAASVDSDKDGYPDNVDDFPTDPNLHIKSPDIGTSISSPHTYTLESGKGEGFGGYIESDWKYIDVKWSVTDPSSLTEEQMGKIYLHITNPSTNGREVQYYYNNLDDREFRIIVNGTNWGEWNWGFNNLIGYPLSPINITIRFEIYKIK